MAAVQVNYLKIDKHYYTNGQSVCNKEDAMMPTSKINYYLDGSSRRGLIFSVEVEEIEVNEEDVEAYSNYGYQVIY